MIKQNIDIQIPTVAEMAAKGETPEVLFWVGCAGSFDQNAQSVTRSFAKILNHLEINVIITIN